MTLTLTIASSFSHRAPARCEFKLQGTPLSVRPEDLPEYCATLSPEDKIAWESENDKLDEFYAKLDAAESKLSSPDFKMAENGGRCPDFGGNSTQNGTDGMDFYLRFEMYDRLRVFDGIANCNNIPTVVEHCECMNNLRMNMIQWLDDCVMVK